MPWLERQARRFHCGLRLLSRRQAAGRDPNSSTSRKLHEREILTMPYLTNLAAITKPRVTLISLPLKMKNVEASPIRAIAIEE